MKKITEKIPISKWSEDDRPREKMIMKGVFALSDAELIAILLGKGNKQETAVDLAKRILISQENNLNQLGRLSITDLMKFKGIGSAKAVTIAAALELGRRRNISEVLELPVITESRSAYKLMQPMLSDLNHEEFWVILLNQSNKVIERFLVSKGGITATLVDVRLILKRALEVMATGMIIVHNHPSGKRLPSVNDKDITQKIKSSAKVMDISLLDHIIVAGSSYFSFADEGMI